MGSASSKTTRGVGRKYPAMRSGVNSPNASPRPNPKRHASPRTTNEKSDDIRADAMDPDAVAGDFSQRLRQMGVVQPNPTYSPSSTAFPHQISGGPNHPAGSPGLTFVPSKSNPTLSALEARRQLQHQADAEFEGLGTSKTRGQRLVNMRTLVDALVLLDDGMPRDEVEQKLNLENGLLEKLGGPGTLSHESTTK